MAALAALLQCALLLFNLVLRWNNFTRGMLEYLYIQILISALSAGTAFMFLSGFFSLKKTAGALPSRLGALDEHYKKLGIQRGNVAVWEDGTRTGAGEKGTYEWWYFDAHLEDGTSLVVVFYTKPMMSPESAADPHVTFRLIVPGEQEYSAVLRPERGTFSASKERCDVRIGDCYSKIWFNQPCGLAIRGNDFSAAVERRGIVPRPDLRSVFTGFLLFGVSNDTP